MSRVAVVTVMVALFAILSGAGAARGEECYEEEIIIQFEANVFGSEGEVVEVARIAVDAHLIGATCIGTATVENNSSAHPGNDFIISSGGSSVVISDFERDVGTVTAATSQLVLGETVTASIRLGPHGIASLAGDTVVVVSVCQPQPPPTTTTTQQPPTTAQQPPTTTQAPAAIAAETPIGGVVAGGGGAAPANSGFELMMLGVGALALLGAFGLSALALRATRR
jgi:hypothetical protein